MKWLLQAEFEPYFSKSDHPTHKRDFGTVKILFYDLGPLLYCRIVF